MQENFKMDKSSGGLGGIELVVTIYLIIVAFFLITANRIKVPSFLKVVKAIFRQPYSGELDGFIHDEGNCWIVPVPKNLISDEEGVSRLVVYENTVPLSGPHSCHSDIRKMGGGRYSHWGHNVYLSSSDNSSPLLNGRIYTVIEKK